MKVLLSGGGTAGHINPALAAAGYLSRTKGAEILFIGTEKGLESKLVPKAGYPIRYIKVSGLCRSLSLENLSVLKQFIVAIGHAKKILKEWKPDVVIGTGGYVCAPVLFAAYSLKIPTVIHEQNVIPGVTVKLTAKKADKICISFPETTKYLKPELAHKCVLTGNPIRGEMLSINKTEARKKLGLDSRPFIVAFGGSLGAEALNHAMTGLLNRKDIGAYQFMLGTGQRYFDSVMKEIKQTDTSIRVVPYIDNMDEVMAAADVVIGRAGALTVSELAVLGKPAVLVPSPNVAHDHQTYNARSLEKAGCAALVLEKDLTADSLYSAVMSIVSNPEKAALMSEKAQSFGIKDGTERIANAALSLIQSK